MSRYLAICLVIIAASSASISGSTTAPMTGTSMNPSTGTSPPDPTQSCCFNPVIKNEIYISEKMGLKTPRRAAQDLDYRDCAELLRAGFNESGKYEIRPDGAREPFTAFCDMTTSGGGWTVFQRRQDGGVDFYRGWAAYRAGFGRVEEEHWLGNDNLRFLTAQKRYALRVDLEDWEGQMKYAEYDRFLIADEDLNFRLTVGEYNGTAGDSMGSHSGREFSARDVDHDTSHDRHCAKSLRGGWWYGGCYHAKLNGIYYDGGQYDVNDSGAYDGVVWARFKDARNYSLKRVEMKLRPLQNQ